MTQRQPGRLPKIGPYPQCKFELCSATSQGGSKGFCHTHYIYTRRGIIDAETGKQLRPFLRVGSYGPGQLCSVEHCPRRARSEGLCHAHWQRLKKGQPLNSIIQERPTGPFTSCLVNGCVNRASSRGMCPNHAARRNSGLIDVQGNKLRDPIRRSRTKARWIGQEGYVLVAAPKEHPRARQDGTILEHRLVMEQAVGRYLEEWEIVHHKDGNRSNNVLENLELLDGRAWNGREAHPPGHDFDPSTAVQVLLQRSDLPEPIRASLEAFRQSLTV